jgi:hypothetical protein
MFLRFRISVSLWNVLEAIRPTYKTKFFKPPFEYYPLASLSSAFQKFSPHASV